VGTPQLSRHFGANCQSAMAEIALNVPAHCGSAFPMRTTSCAVNSNLDDVWAGGTEVRKAATTDTASWR
jgi:hypothetical protein